MTEPTSGTGLCVLPHKRDTTADVGLVCDHHAAGMNETLQDIVELFATCRALYLLPGTLGGDGSRHLKQPHAPAPLNLGVAALSDTRATMWDPEDDSSGIPDVVGVLGEEADRVRDERPLQQRQTARTMTSEVDLLRAHRDWICAQDWVIAYDRTLRGLRRAILRETGGDQKRKPIGRCPAKDGDGTPCDGPLWPDRYGAMAVDCGRCGIHIDERMLANLGGAMTG